MKNFLVRFILLTFLASFTGRCEAQHSRKYTEEQYRERAYMKAARFLPLLKDERFPLASSVSVMLMPGVEFSSDDKDAGNILVLAKIVPAPGSGRLEEVKSVSSEENTQKAENHGVHVFEGEIESIANLSGAPLQKKWTYKTSHWANADLRTIALKDLGYCICEIKNNAATKSEQVRALWLLPTEWKDDVVPAYEFYRSNESTFKPDKDGANYEKLSQLLKGKNQIIALMAFRTLLSQDMFFIIDLDDIIIHDGVLLSILSTELATPRYGKHEEASERVLALIEKADTRSKLYRIALGIRFQYETGKVYLEDVENSNQVAKIIHERLQKLPPDAIADEHFKSLYGAIIPVFH